MWRKTHCSTHGSIPAHFIPIQLMGTKLQLPTGENAELKTQCRLQERGKGAVKHTVCSMQALRPLRHNDPLQLKLSTWLRSLCPGRLLWSRSSGGSTSCAALPRCPSCSQAHAPALQQHCRPQRCCSDKWPSLRGSLLHEPWHKSPAHCTGL